MTSLEKLVRPRSVAVVGASPRPGSLGNTVTRNVVHHSRIAGDIYLINPNHSEIEGFPCRSAIEELPMGGVDTAVIVVGAASVVDAVERCAARGVSYAIIPSGGLGEAGEEGRQIEARLSEIVAETGIRVYGPNCPGLSNINDRIFLSVSPGAEHDVTEGSIGLATQGGALGRNVMQFGDRGVGIGCWLSAGNEVDLEMADFIEHFIKDERITTIACVIEGFRDGPRFLRAVERANAAGKPVVAMVLGQSESGARAAQSHTAHMATDSKVVRALLHQHGVTVVDDIDELVEQALTFVRGIHGQETRACVLSFSGGAAVAATDALDGAGITPAMLSSDTERRLALALPAFASSTNPIDLTMEAMRDVEITSGAVAALEHEAAVNTLVVAVPGDYGSITGDFVDAVLPYQKPGRHVVVVWSSPRRGEGCALLESRGLMPFATTRGMARALARAQDYREWLERRNRRNTNSTPVPAATGTFTETHLSEHTVKSLLSTASLPVVQGSLCTDRASATATAERLGYPVVLKLQSAAVSHKTEIGGVALGLQTVEQVSAAWDQLMGSAKKAGLPDDQLDGILVESMAPTGTDLIVAIHRNPIFGLVCAVGLGGIFTEVLNDITFLVGPTDAEELEAALRTLSGWPVFEGARGSQPVPIAELAHILNKLLQVAENEELDELEVNPLRSCSNDGSLLVLDALAQRSRRAALPVG